MSELFFKVLQCPIMDSNTESTIKSQNENLKLPPMCGVQKNINFQKKNHLDPRSYVKVITIWSSKNEDYPSDLMRKLNFWKNGITWAKTNHSTMKSVKILPQIKKIALKNNFVCLRYSTPKLRCKKKNSNEEGSKFAQIYLRQVWWICAIFGGAAKFV